MKKLGIFCFILTSRIVCRSELMKLCWQKNEKRRPQFSEILAKLLPDLSENFHNASYCCDHLASSIGLAEDWTMNKLTNEYTYLTSSYLNSILSDASKGFKKIAHGMWKPPFIDQERSNCHQQLKVNMMSVLGSVELKSIHEKL